MRITAPASLLLICALVTSEVRAAALTPDERQRVVQSVSDDLTAYAFPKVAVKMKAALEANQAEYLRIGDRDELARRLTSDLRASSHDLHVNVLANGELPAEAPTRAAQQADALRSAKAAYGFTSVDRLPGNIGYVDLRSFTYGPEAEQYVSSALDLMSNTASLIIDLRENHGGRPEMVELIAGALLGRRELLITVYTRQKDGTVRREQAFSRPLASGQAYSSPVYVLTSSKTFSAAEYLTFVLQADRRAKVFGEKTGGGGNPGDVLEAAEGFSVFVPTSYIEGAVTHTTWEAVGVQPDTPTPAGEALVAAYKDALSRLDLSSLSERERKAVTDARASPQTALRSIFAE